MSNIVKRNGQQPATFGSIVDQVFQNNLSRFFDDSFWDANAFATSKKPAVNIRETEKAYQIEMSVPGLQKQDFQLHVTGNLLTVSYEHKKEQQPENNAEGWIRREFEKSSFTRTFTLDESVDSERIQARYEHGILHLELPKSEKSRKFSRTVSIQ